MIKKKKKAQLHNFKNLLKMFIGYILFGKKQQREDKSVINHRSFKETRNMLQIETAISSHFKVVISFCCCRAPRRGRFDLSLWL